MDTCIYQHMIKYVPLFEGVVFVTNIDFVVMLLHITPREGVGRQSQSKQCAIKREGHRDEVHHRGRGYNHTTPENPSHPATTPSLDLFAAI